MEKREFSRSAPAAALIESQRKKKHQLQQYRGISTDETLKYKEIPLSRRAGSLRSNRSKSMSSIFQKTFSFRKKESEVLAPRTELSTENAVPGVLRIFGDAISPGTQYKSVLASSDSTAEELVKDALERYTISVSYARHFVLCDVIGKFVPYSSNFEDYLYSGESESENQWQEACIRIIGDNERPLILQSFWKPAEGFSRRFELRNRGEFVSIENFEYNPFNESTPKPNRQSKYDLNKGRSRSLNDKLAINTFGIPDASLDLDSIGITSSEDNTSKNDLSDKVEYVNETAFTSERHKNVLSIKRQDSLGASIMGEEDGTSISRMGMSNDVPLLINLKGTNPQNDNLVHFLFKECTVIGCDIIKLCQTDICLPADDILSQHCRLWKDKTGKCSIEPCQGALVKINNLPILQRVQLNPGDILCLGNHYIFMFRDAKVETQSLNHPQNFAFVKLLQSGNFETDLEQFFCDNKQTAEILETIIPSEDSSNSQSHTKVGPRMNIPPPLPPKPQEPATVIQWRQEKLQKYTKDFQRLKIAYLKEKEDELLSFILNTLKSHPGVYQLTPAYLLCMCLEYSAVKYDQVSTRQFLIKTASRVQGAILENTKKLAEDQRQVPANTSSLDIEQLLPDLREVIIWLVNSLEILNFLNNNLSEYVLESEVSLPKNARHSIVAAEEEVIVVLEDIVMYSFQQTVYYITKCLYSALPAILDSNPFAEEDSMNEKLTMESLLSIFQTTLNFLLECNVHPQISSQLFSYLFFFTNTSLINTLMTPEAAVKYYKWSSGVRLRGNMDALDTWAVENHLHEEATTQMKKLNCLVDLLATQKVKLMQCDWISLCQEFPHLSKAQLHNVMRGYCIDTKSRPQHWSSTQDLELVDQEEDLKESFNSHPPLTLPTEGFMLDLHRKINDIIFYDVISEAEALYGVQVDGDPSKHSARLNISNQTATNHSKNQLNDLQNVQDHHPISSLQKQAKVEYPHIQTNENVPWYHDQSPEENSNVMPSTITPWSSGEYTDSYNDSGFATLRSQDNRLDSRESLQRSSNRFGENISSKKYGNESINHKTSHQGSLGNIEDTTTSRKEVTPSTVYPYDHNSNQKQSSLCVNNDQKSLRKSSHQKTEGNTSDTSTNKNNDPLYMNMREIKHQMHQHGLETTLPKPVAIYKESPNSARSTASSNHSSSSYKSAHEYLRGSQHKIKDKLSETVMQRGDKVSPKRLPDSYLAASKPVRNNQYPLSRPKPLNRVPPLDLHKLQEDSSDQELFTDEYVHVEVNKQSSLSQRSAQNGLRVLPLTTDDKQRTDHTRVVRECDMDALLYSRTMLENRHFAQALKNALSNHGRYGDNRRASDQDEEDDVFSIEIDKNDVNDVLGLGLIDGLYTPLRKPGIYVRTLIPGAPADLDGRIQLGDRILAVNETSIIGADHQSATKLIQNGNKKVKLLVAKSDQHTRNKVIASTC